jgi:threonine dehydrogenase-like Zn-dependent dehydrogenase
LARLANNALRNAGLRAGDPVAVQGIGGLGHLGIQFARHMGFRTAAIGRGREKEKLAKDLGAHVYIDGTVEDVGAALQRMGGDRAILASGTSSSAMRKLVSDLSAVRCGQRPGWKLEQRRHHRLSPDWGTALFKVSRSKAPSRRLDREGVAGQP